jgi:hypothetical protein
MHAVTGATCECSAQCFHRHSASVARVGRRRSSGPAGASPETAALSSGYYAKRNCQSSADRPRCSRLDLWANTDPDLCKRYPRTGRSCTGPMLRRNRYLRDKQSLWGRGIGRDPNRACGKAGPERTRASRNNRKPRCHCTIAPLCLCTDQGREHSPGRSLGPSRTGRRCCSHRRGGNRCSRCRQRTCRSARRCATYIVSTHRTRHLWPTKGCRCPPCKNCR